MSLADGDPRHGTAHGYTIGCRCSDCRDAKSLYAAQYRLTAPPGSLAVTCWCEARIVHVSAGDVAVGLTGACRRLWCRRMNRERRDRVAA